ncbi:MAG: hypothetical protein QM796_13785 [Chthoniobacteraceae bacterium]
MSSVVSPAKIRQWNVPTVDQIMVEERAASFSKRSIKNEAKLSGLQLVVSMMDLTTLEGKDTPGKVAHLCRKAIQPMAPELGVPSCAAVCVYPNLVRAAKHFTAGSGVKVAAVATAFPSGQMPLPVKLDDTRAAVAEGADEIDMVIDRGAFHAGEYVQGFRRNRSDERSLWRGAPEGDSRNGRTRYLRQCAARQRDRHARGRGFHQDQHRQGLPGGHRCCSDSIVFPY